MISIPRELQNINIQHSYTLKYFLINKFPHKKTEALKLRFQLFYNQ